MALTVENIKFLFSPISRGASDSIKGAILNFIEKSKGDLFIGSQQFCDLELTESLIKTVRSNKSKAKIFIENSYLKEKRADNITIWEEYGKRVLNRKCFIAVLRAGLDIRSDKISSALQHMNIIVNFNTEENNIDLFFTSANLSEGSLNRHYNWGIEVLKVPSNKPLKKAINEIWNYTFKNVNKEFKFYSDTNKSFALCISSTGGVLESIIEMIKKAKFEIYFSYFNISVNNEFIDELIKAHERGVNIIGIVDGDQQMQSWDAVPKLISKNIDIKYYPGQLTGSIGRMHYKIISIDSKFSHFGTSNISKSASSSLELGIMFSNEKVADLVKNEVQRLFNSL